MSAAPRPYRGPRPQLTAYPLAVPSGPSYDAFAPAGPPASSPPSLADVARRLWNLRIPLVLLLALCSVDGYVLGRLLPDRFTSTMVLKPADARNRVGVFGGPPPVEGLSLEALADLATAPGVREDAAAKAGATLSDIKAVHARREESDTITVEVTASRARTATRVAAGIGDAVIARRQATIRGELGAISADLRARAAGYDPEVAQLRAALSESRGEVAALASPRAVDAATAVRIAQVQERVRQQEAALDATARRQELLRERADELDVETERADPGVTVVSQAGRAKDTTRPKPVDLALLLPLIGLLVAAAIAYIRLALPPREPKPALLDQPWRDTTEPEDDELAGLAPAPSLVAAGDDAADE